jgi:hypothetical protein
MSRQVFLNCDFHADSAPTTEPFMCKNFEQQYDVTRRIQDAVGSIWTAEWTPRIRNNPVHNWIVAGDMFWI